MKYLYKALTLLSLLAFPLNCAADIDDNSVGNESLINPNCLKPFRVNLTADVTGRSTIEKRYFESGKIFYSTTGIFGDYTFYFNPRCMEGTLATVGFTHEIIDWNQNPYFDQKYFNTLRLGVKAFSGRLNGWFWQAYINVNLDTDYFNFSQYSTWDLLIWGKYTFRRCPEASLHFGILALTGMKIDRVSPVIGFDWQYSKNLKINAVFPVKLSVEYTINKFYTTGVAGRFFESRHRTGSDECRSRALVEYQNYGTELFLTYDDCCWMFANLHAGYLTGGKLRIANRHNRWTQWFTIPGAPYGGAEVAIKF